MTESNHCRSFFQNGSLAPTVESVTTVWLRLIEQLERSGEAKEAPLQQ
ncbi:MAG: hypothetical protein IJV64_04400 [Oscillospiraceae bacterium]|nr:hypothetical protein [Oscillospiraceae bacterium]